MEIIEEKDNFLVNRKEVKVIVENDTNPSYKEAKERVVEEFDEDSSKVVIKKVKGKFGRNTFLISAFIYNSEEDKKEFELEEDMGKEEESGGEEVSEGEEEAKEEKEKAEEDSSEDKKKEDNDKEQEKGKEGKEDKDKESDAK